MKKPPGGGAADGCDVGQSGLRHSRHWRKVMAHWSHSRGGEPHPDASCWPHTMQSRKVMAAPPVLVYRAHFLQQMSDFFMLNKNRLRLLSPSL
jgi:hypothetical protein